MTKFKTGDKVRVKAGQTASSTVSEGKEFTVRSYDSRTDLVSLDGVGGGFYSYRFESASIPAPVATLKPQLQALLNVLKSAEQPLSAETIATRANMVAGTNVAGRIRDLRTAKYGSHKIETQRDGKATLYKLAA